MPERVSYSTLVHSVCSPIQAGKQIEFIYDLNKFHCNTHAHKLNYFGGGRGWESWRERGAGLHVRFRSGQRCKMRMLSIWSMAYKHIYMCA